MAMLYAGSSSRAASGRGAGAKGALSGGATNGATGMPATCSPGSPRAESAATKEPSAKLTRSAEATVWALAEAVPTTMRTSVVGEAPGAGAARRARRSRRRLLPEAVATKVTETPESDTGAVARSTVATAVRNFGCGRDQRANRVTAARSGI